MNTWNQRNWSEQTHVLFHRCHFLFSLWELEFIFTYLSVGVPYRKQKCTLKRLCVLYHEKYECRNQCVRVCLTLHLNNMQVSAVLHPFSLCKSTVNLWVFLSFFLQLHFQFSDLIEQRCKISFIISYKVGSKSYIKNCDICHLHLVYSLATKKSKNVHDFCIWSQTK